MKKEIYVVAECDKWGGNPNIVGVFETLEAAISNIISNGGYSQDELNCVSDMRQYLADHLYTPDLSWNYRIEVFNLNEFIN